MRRSSSGAAPVTDVAFVALGSNLGDRNEFLARAREALAALPESRIAGTSTIEETAPLGPADQPAYLNQMVALETALSPRVLLEHLLEIERTAGRRRDVRWGPRTLDLDIVAYRHATVNDPDLQVPHRELPNRDFWQRELAELAVILSEAKDPFHKGES
jgi:2-amino-4-hydroxy-6-hydroxymethyldihydropteridine diphosphokinase